MIALMFAVPVAPLVHGLQSGTTTGPGTPRAAIWMCAAMASPVRPPNDSRQLSAVPLSDFVRVPVKDPRAEVTSPFGVGVSSPATIVATICTRVAWLRATAAPEIRSPIATPTAPATKKSRFTEFPLPAIGIAGRPLHCAYGSRAKADCGVYPWRFCVALLPRMGDALRAADGRCSGQVTAVGGHGEQAANTYTVLDGLEAPVDFRVGWTFRDGNVRKPPVDRPGFARSAAPPGCRRRPGQQRCDLPQQCGSRRTGQPHALGCRSAHRPSSPAPLPAASYGRPARQGTRDQTAQRRRNVCCAAGYRAPSGPHGNSCRRPPRRRELAGRLKGFHAGPVAACTPFAPRSAAACPV